MVTPSVGSRSTCSSFTAHSLSSSFGDDNTLRGGGMKIAPERKTSGRQRRQPYLSLRAPGNNLFDRGAAHLEFVRFSVRIGDYKHDGLAGRYVNFRRREMMILECDPNNRQVLATGRRDAQSQAGGGYGHGEDWPQEEA